MACIISCLIYTMKDETKIHVVSAVTPNSQLSHFTQYPLFFLILFAKLPSLYGSKFTFKIANGVVLPRAHKFLRVRSDTNNRPRVQFVEDNRIGPFISDPQRLQRREARCLLELILDQKPK